MSNMNKTGKSGLPVLAVLVVLFLSILVVGGVSNSESTNQDTPMATAKIFAKAMVENDAKLMDKINRSEPFLVPTSYCMEVSTNRNYRQFDLDDIEYEQNNDDTVMIHWPDGSDTEVPCILENGKWYYYGWSL